MGRKVMWRNVVGNDKNYEETNHRNSQYPANDICLWHHFDQSWYLGSKVGELRILFCFLFFQTKNETFSQEGLLSHQVPALSRASYTSSSFLATPSRLVQAFVVECFKPFARLLS